MVSRWKFCSCMEFRSVFEDNNVHHFNISQRGFRCVRKTNGSWVSDEDDGVAGHPPRFNFFADMKKRLQPSAKS